MAGLKVFSLFLLSASSIAVVIPNTDKPIVDLGYANVTSFFGLRYAAPPTGNNRWRAPLPIEKYGGHNNSIILATSQGPACVQGLPAWISSSTAVVDQEEDCLTVDVLVPNKPANLKLPVWVEIHGGGYTLGSASLLPGYAMVNQSHGGLIFVDVQYRLGSYGFLSSSEIREDGIANAGLLDQRAALEWVQRHIESFGGDPRQVTIHGGSAGGGSVTNHLIMYGGVADPPFRAAIAEYPWWQPYHNETVLESQYRQLLQETSCTDLNCLRHVPESNLVAASQATYTDGYLGDVSTGDPQIYGFGDFYYGPSIDGIIIPDLPSKMFLEGRFAKVPYLTDREGYEGVVFSNPLLSTMSQVDSDLKEVWPQAPQTFFDALFELYPATAYNSSFYQRAAIFGDAFISCPSYQTATALARAGQPTWKMIFDAGSEVHGATAPFLFGESSDGTIMPSGNDTLSLLMKDWFISFATSLDPNAISYSGVAKPFWPQYGVAHTVLDIDYTTIGAKVDDDFSAHCKFLKLQGLAILN
ncbi:hypothetical protein B7494_g2955 [Chlorociboria aeruginascens]|nr:hypothetical protein B7494_g2955 [Chlorociboria aeruginascens]